MDRILPQGVDTMQIRPSASIRQNYNELRLFLCKSSSEPVYLTKNGEGDLVVYHREKMLKLSEELLTVEEDRLVERAGVLPDELDSYLDSIIGEVEHRKEASILGDCLRPCPSDVGEPRSVSSTKKPHSCP